MEKYFKVSLFLAALILSACSTSEIPELDSNVQQTKSEIYLTVNEVNDIAQKAYLDFFGQSESRTSHNGVKISDTHLYVDPTSSRAGKIDTTFYIVEFENDGFAIVAADKRLNKNVYAISNEGSFGQTPIPPVQMYLSMMADEIKKEVEDTLSLQPWKKPVTPEIVKVYFINGVEYYGTPVTSVKSKSPIVKTAWNQYGNGLNTLGIQYNSYCMKPETGTQLYLAGCVSIAISQIAAHMKKPSQLGDRTYNWNEITAYPKMYQLEEQNQDDLAYFIHQIGLLVNTDYGLDGSGATFNDAVKAFKDMGYTTNPYNGFASSSCVTSINDNRPVLLRGENSDGGHEWVCSGYRIETTTVDLYRKDNDQFYRTIAAEDASYYMNWGWGGNQNAYYAMDASSSAKKILFNKNVKTLIVK